MKITAFWDVAPCSLVEVDRRFSCSYCLYHYPEDGISAHLRNVCILRDWHGAIYQKTTILFNLLNNVRKAIRLGLFRTPCSLQHTNSMGSEVCEGHNGKYPVCTELLEMGRNVPVYHTGTSYCSWISYRHLPIYTISIYIFQFSDGDHCFAFKKHTITSSLARQTCMSPGLLQKLSPLFPI
jgi:hypothetical protein